MADLDLQACVASCAAPSGLMCKRCAEYIGAETHAHTAINFGVMITHFRGRQSAEQEILRCNGFILIVPGDQYQATLISHSRRKSPHL